MNTDVVMVSNKKVVTWVGEGMVLIEIALKDKEHIIYIRVYEE